MIKTLILLTSIIINGNTYELASASDFMGQITNYINPSELIVRFYERGRNGNPILLERITHVHLLCNAYPEFTLFSDFIKSVPVTITEYTTRIPFSLFEVPDGSWHCIITHTYDTTGEIVSGIRYVQSGPSNDLYLCFGDCTNPPFPVNIPLAPDIIDIK
jgi:hypothetical protein